jgi:APA family basic amino acid/polyamine antiporter
MQARSSKLPQLERQLGVFELTATGVGIILVAGIYVLIGEAAGISGNGVWLPFVISAFAATFTGITYAELASWYPKAGATSSSPGVRSARAWGSLPDGRSCLPP